MMLIDDPGWIVMSDESLKHHKRKFKTIQHAQAAAKQLVEERRKEGYKRSYIVARVVEIHQ